MKKLWTARVEKSTGIALWAETYEEAVKLAELHGYEALREASDGDIYVHHKPLDARSIGDWDFADQVPYGADEALTCDEILIKQKNETGV